MIRRLKKLRNVSVAELADRGRQQLAVLSERAGFSYVQVPGDQAFLRLFRNDSITDTEALHSHFVSRTPCFHWSFTNSEETLSLFRSRFPGEVIRVVDRADRICGGKFDLLGYTGLEFGTPVPDWHFEPVSGKRSPRVHWSLIDETDPQKTGDKKIVWEINRHQYFTVLGTAYLLTGDERYAATFVSHLEDWIMNDPPKIGLNWGSSLEIAYRSISWVWAFHFFKNSPVFDPAVLIKMLKVLVLNGRHLTRHLSTYTSPNTHLTGEALGLYVIGSFLTEIEEAGAWKTTGEDILLNSLDLHIRSDGGYVEQAVHYHRYTADLYLSLCLLLQAEGKPIADKLAGKLRSMLEFLVHIQQPDGRVPLIGDEDGGRLHFLDFTELADVRPTLALGAVILNDGVLKFAAGEPTAELLWLAGPSGLAKFDSLEPREPASTKRSLSSSGFYSARSLWSSDADHLLIDCGEHGFLNGGHAHADALSFVFSVSGMPVLVDSGTYTYTADMDARDRFRSTAAHNCLMVNGQSSSIPDGPFSWRRTANAAVLEWTADEGRTVLRGTHDGYANFGVQYEREFEFLQNGRLTITDRVSSKDENLYEFGLVIHPLIDAEIVDEQHIVLRTKDGNRDVLAVDSKLTETAVRQVGWRREPAKVSFRYGSSVDTVRLVFAFRCSGSAELRTVFTPARVSS